MCDINSNTPLTPPPSLPSTNPPPPPPPPPPTPLYPLSQAAAPDIT